MLKRLYLCAKLLYMDKNYFKHKHKKPQIVDNYQPSGNATDLQRPIEQLNLSENIYNALKAGKITCLKDLAIRKMTDMYKIQNIGKKACIEISKKMSKFGVAFRPDNAQQESGALSQSTKQNKQPNVKEGERTGVKQSKQNDRRKGNQTKQDNNVGSNQIMPTDNSDNMSRMSAPRNKEQRNAFLNCNKGQNDSLSRQFSGLTINEILMGKRQRPVSIPNPKQPLTPDSIIKFCRNGRWGYKDWKGNVLIQPTYDEAFAFSEGLACVEKNGKLGYIDTKNNLVIDFKYDTATSFSEGLASVTLDEKSGYIDKQGNVVIDFKYEIATQFNQDKAIVFLDGRWGVLSKDGKVLWR